VSNSHYWWLKRPALQWRRPGFGNSTPQIHVLSNDDAGVERNQLNQVEAVLKKDVVRGTELGAVVGIAGGALILLLSGTRVKERPPPAG
jgi:hypothetical protein